jgi:hypothetical protein
LVSQLFSGMVEHVSQYTVALLESTVKHIEHQSASKPHLTAWGSYETTVSAAPVRNLELLPWEEEAEYSKAEYSPSESLTAGLRANYSHLPC